MGGQDWWMWPMGGGGKGTPKMPSNPYEAAMAKIAQQYYAETQPVRTGVLGQLGKVVGGDYDVLNLPAYKPMYDVARGGLESQFGQARQNILANVPRGGALTSALTTADLARAQAVGQLPASLSAPIIQNMFGQAVGTATQAPGTSMGGLGGAASSFGARSAADVQSQMQAQAMQNQMYGGLGSGLGMLGAAALMKSDIRTKENIKGLSESSLSRIMALPVKEFDYLPEHGGTHQVGFIADEIESIIPEAVVTDNNGLKWINLMPILAHLVKSVQEMKHG